MEEDIKIVEELVRNNYLEDLGYLRDNNHYIRFNQALENLIKGYKELDKDNNDLRRLYRRTAVKLKENGHEEVADYFLAQINEVPTFVVEDDIDYYAEYYKMKTKIRELEEREIWSTATINGLKRDFIPKSKIKEKIEELDNYHKKEIYTSKYQWADIGIREYYENQILLLQELMEDK